MAELRAQRQQMKDLAASASSEDERRAYLEKKAVIDRKLKAVVADEHNLRTWRKMTDSAKERRGVVNKGAYVSRRYEEERAKALNDLENERLLALRAKAEQAEVERSRKLEKREADAAERARIKAEKEAQHKAEMAERKRIRDQKREERRPEVEAAAKAYRQRYWQEHKEEKLAYQREWKKKHPGYDREYRRRRKEKEGGSDK